MSVVSSRSKFHCWIFSQPFRRHEGCLVTKRRIREKEKEKRNNYSAVHWNFGMPRRSEESLSRKTREQPRR